MSCGQNKLSGGGSAGELTDVEIYPRQCIFRITTNQPTILNERWFYTEAVCDSLVNVMAFVEHNQDVVLWPLPMH